MNIKGDSLEAFFKVDKKKKEDKLEWLNRLKDALIDESSERTAAQRRHLKAYMGLDSNDALLNNDYRDAELRRRKRIRKFRVPHINDIIETKVSQMTRLKPEVEVLPANDEFTDRGAAKVSKAVISQIFSQQELDYKLIKMHRQARIFGESYLFIDYDQHIGDLDPEYVEAKERGMEIPKNVNRKLGDVKYTLELPWRVLLQRKEDIQDVEYYLRYSIKSKDEILAKYPQAEQVITEDSEVGSYVFDIDTMEDMFMEDHVAVWEFVHRRTEAVADGKRMVFIEGMVLEEGDYPHSMDEFNFERLTDIDLPGYLNGLSKLEYALPIQKMYDDLSTLISKNIYMTAHAKWILPTGSVRQIEQLGNDNTVVQYSGPIPPQILQVAPNPAEVYNHREGIKQELQIVMGSHGISRGEVPKGITASSALQFLNELESERASSDISKHAGLIKSLARKSLSIAADNYDMEGERLVRIVGKNNAPLIKHFDAAVLSRPYDIKFDSSDGFPETKAAKTERLLNMMQRYPQLFSPERWEQLLEVGNTERAVKLSTQAVESADSENEDLMSGNFVGSPEIFEDHIMHWKSHVSAMQSRALKEEASNETYVAFLEHLAQTEKLMVEKAKSNPLFSAELANLRLFPITPSLAAEAAQVAQSRAQREAMVQGQANRGEPISTAIPGQGED